MAEFDFDQAPDRRLTPALKVHPMVLGEDGSGLFPGGVADMDFPVAPAIVRAMRERLEHPVFGYETVPDRLLPCLRRWLSDRHDWQVDERTILRAPNVLNTLSMAVNLFSREGEGVIVQPPVFFDFFDILKENHRECVLNPLVLEDGHYRMNFDDLEAKAALPDTRMLFLCNPHNPVGRVWSRAELETVAEICERHDVLVVADEIHGDIVYPGANYIPFASLNGTGTANAITCLSPAKSFNIASCCCAFTIIPNEGMRAAFQAENSRLTVNKNNALANPAMVAAYSAGGPWLDAVIEYLEGNVTLVRNALADTDRVKLIEPQGTFLLWMDFRALNLDPKALTGFLRNEAGWAVTRGEAFGEQGEGFARVNIACSRNALERALDGLVASLRA